MSRRPRRVWFTCPGPIPLLKFGHNRWHRGQERRQYREDERERGGGRDRDGRGQRDQWRH
jgi:hypothetical protein